MFVAEHDTRKWFFKNRYMTSHYIHDYPMPYKYTDLKKVTIQHVFENRYGLALNHWIGLVRIDNDHGYTQHLVSCAAGDTAEATKRIWENIKKHFEDYELEIAEQNHFAKTR